MTERDPITPLQAEALQRAYEASRRIYRQLNPHLTREEGEGRDDG